MNYEPDRYENHYSKPISLNKIELKIISRLKCLETTNYKLTLN